MSAHTTPASADIAVENRSENDDTRNSLHAAEPAVESKPQQGQPKQRGWISEAEWLNYIQSNLDGDHLRSQLIVSIFRVPNYLKELKREAYVPQSVSLGPYHHTNAELSPMDSHKGRAMCRMMRRYNDKPHSHPNKMRFCSLAKDEIWQMEGKIRKAYAEKIDCEGHNLALMLSLDGCFILEIFRALFDKGGNYYEPIFEVNKITNSATDILNDIVKLENQIPLTVLGKLLKLEHNSAYFVEKMRKRLLVTGPALMFYPFKYEMKKWLWPQPDEQKHHHILGLLHTIVVSPPSDLSSPPSDRLPCDPLPVEERIDVFPTGESDRADQTDPRDGVIAAENYCVPRAVELRNAGIHFKICDGGIQGIRFDQKSATIYLPPIIISERTEILFRNLIVYEMFKPSAINYVTHYMKLMDQLVDSEEDVALLRKARIVRHSLGSDAAVAQLFNGLCSGVTVDVSQDVFGKLTENVNKHYRNKFRVQFAQLVKHHFSSPWKIFALVAATVLLLLTAVQTIVSILSMHSLFAVSIFFRMNMPSFKRAKAKH